MSMKTFNLLIIILTVILSLSLPIYSQNCSNNTTGLVPITDLGTNTYQGFKGGLYFGSNTKPVKHSNNLNKAISNISPLNSNGITDPSNGKIVLLSIGASNPKTEFDVFIDMADTLEIINPFLTIVNGCQGGKSLQKIKDSTENYWKFVENELNSKQVNPLQVQIIWLEEENTQSKNYNFPSAPKELMLEFKELFTTLLHYYPNLQICYLNGRGYAGYVDELSTAGAGLQYPRDYYNGWAMKWLIEDQINGDATLSFTGSDRKAPLLDWSAYLWADGDNPRSDGLSWECPTDVKPDDGLHWSPIGNNKAGKKIFERFYTDTEARKWFLNNSITSVAENTEVISLQIYPNPNKDYFSLRSNLNEVFDVSIYNSLGELVKAEKAITNESIVKHNLSAGIYFLSIITESNKSFRTKIIIAP